MPIDSSVPQGTALGPFYSQWYFSYPPECASSQIRLFSDDGLLHRPIYCDKDLAIQNIFRFMSGGLPNDVCG